MSAFEPWFKERLVLLQVNWVILGQLSKVICNSKGCNFKETCVL